MSDYSICPRPREDQQAYRPCLMCGLPILTAETVQGGVLHLDVLTPCYGVAWPTTAAMPTACESPAYAVHQCAHEGAGTRRGKRQQRHESRPSLGTTGETEFSPEVWREMAERFRRMLQREAP
jgi:hypothetical protein